jgi:FlaA1/EpsC-like NDP-sugar epimerase/lipopolysaccharide/colanic/teichoic acid biosynthesis glycosyltransferase
MSGLGRAVDLVVACLALVLLAPVWLVIALAIKLDSPGPVLYSQARVGLRGRPFRLYKFRSMAVDADRRGPPLTRKDDARVTRLGRWLRPLRLDELPQLFNIVRGDMGLVGPRPELPSIVERYTLEEREVLSVRPGLVGPSHLEGLDESERYPAGVDPVAYYVEHVLPGKLRRDLDYLRRRSLVTDLGCVLRVPWALLRHSRRSLRADALARKVARFSLDGLGVGVANFLAFMLRFDGRIPAQEFASLLYGLPLACVVYAVAFRALGIHRSVWAHLTFEDVWRISRAVCLGAGLDALVVFLLGWRSYPRSVLVLTGLLTIVLLCAARLVMRSLDRAEMAPPARSDRRRTVIVGAGRTGAALCREITEAPALGYEVIGFLDDDARAQGETVHGLPVFGTTAALADVVRRHRVQEVIVGLSPPVPDDLRRIISACVALGIRCRALPSLTELVSGEGKLRYLGGLPLEALLRREPLALDRDRARGHLRGKRVMVTGAGGSIGSELCRQALALGAESLVMVDLAESALQEIARQATTGYPEAAVTVALADVRDVSRMTDLFGRTRPQVVFHAAAYKHVPLLEDHPREAVLNNVVATRGLARLARAFGSESFVFISTDKAASASSVMGATKRICEMYLTSLAEGDAPATRFTVVRFGNVLGSAGSVVPIFRRQVEDGEPLTITDPRASRFFMTIAEAVDLVMLSATIDEADATFVLDMGEPRTITELADDVVMALGMSPVDVHRRYVGLRPGDSLHETLWDQGDDVLPSGHERILMIRPRRRPRHDMEALVDRLEALAVAGDGERLLEELRAAVSLSDSGRRSLA